MFSGANYRLLGLFGAAYAEMSIKSTVGIVFWSWTIHLFIMASVGSRVDSSDQPVADECETDFCPDKVELCLVLIGSMSDAFLSSFDVLVMKLLDGFSFRIEPPMLRS